MSLNLDDVAAAMNKSLSEMEDQVNADLDLDMSDTANVLQLQMDMQKWTFRMNAETNVLKSIADMLKNVSDKYRT